MTRVVAVFLAASVAGLLFVPVFGVWPLALVLVACAVPAFAVAVWCPWASWRAVLAVVAGLVGLLAAVRPADPVGALVVGATEAWRDVLRSTWPVRPDPEAVVFVPLLVLAASVFGVELLHRVRAPLVALLPALAVAGLSQTYAAAGGAPAVVAAVAFAACGAAIVAQGIPWAAVALGVVGAVLLGLVPAGPAFSLRDNESAPLASARVASPLSEVAVRLGAPDTPLFEYTSATPVDRWPIAVLDEFDGVEWTPGGNLRRMGAGLPPGDGVTVPTSTRSASVRMRGLGLPWLPSQAWPATVTGTDPLVAPDRGTLLAEEPVTSYDLTWWEPGVDGATLSEAGVDANAVGGLGGVGEVPAGVAELAEQAVGGMRSSFRAALVLERFLRDDFRLVDSGTLPVGHGWPQLERFLLRDKQGTSEQFAAAYVVLARLRGIPARLVVGFSGRNSLVRNGDVLAWPEVAVAGAGWVALDPTGSARTSAMGGLPGATGQAREELPPAEGLAEPLLPAEPPATAPGAGVPWRIVVWAVVAALLGWLIAVPSWVALRTWRRRRSGTVADAVAEVRDRLRANGVPVTSAMTVRDMAAAVPDPEALVRLATAVDTTLWSGAGVDARQEAWEAVRALRSEFARRPVPVRARAALRYGYRAQVAPRMPVGALT
ncbi:transglutaminaseTgpA domain-containing protein [Umezawaea sp. Da 62-37]|uniref:transglutaminaseTgpA domain-containing protein n=1 Tax=Umezawaea sp. Da 62-37 TaxID=3075927 RepID=UPI0028F71EF0|nr:transglutaminaseTgpA domain-containing protein [Umezawaea sp. Da 62-37]WNV86179.1 transglutaminaseTgpA domain-containing protein [Umezawaea sp. Da 62-37]